MLHIEHIEDSILTGDLSAIETLYSPANVSVKMDGAPAIVWGTNPANGKFFVGTKSVFNKKKIKINYTHEDIDQNHKGDVASILHDCLNYLPHTDHVFQGDFIGWGGGCDTFTPNTITYKFSDPIEQDIIIAPHTFYYDYNGKNDLRKMVSFPLIQLLDDNAYVKWVQPSVDRVRVGSAPNIDTRKINFLTEKEAKEVKIIINAFIREDKPLTDALLTEILGCVHLANLYQMVIEMKEDFMDSLIINDAPKAFIGDFGIKQEGFVITNEHAETVKLVDREVFSNANFNMLKSWKN